MPLPRDPLFRLLAVNLGIGIAAAALMLAGLVALNPGGLRELLLADSAGGVALTLLGAGFVITFGSVAMGAAIMGIGGGAPRGGGRRDAADDPFATFSEWAGEADEKAYSRL